jgi:GcrA cell cycle regulator
VTRNAVIGKVHRLKLSGRAKPATSSARAHSANRTPRRSSGGTSMKRRTVTPVVMGNTALKVSEEVVAYARQEQVAELYVAPENRIGLLALTENTCKWPIGDPLGDEFYFCGGESEEGKPYCEFHSRRAYHQIERKRR